MLSAGKTFYLFIILVLLTLPTQGALAKSDLDFTNWLNKTKREALKKGISPATVHDALSNITLNKRVLKLDKKQPENKITFPKYKRNVINADRINKGRQLYKKHYPLLKKIERQYGVAPQYIIALWGIESNFGANTGGFDIIPALATLAYEGRRETFFTKELYYALNILDERHITVKKMTGSWAGAMGQCQFMPSSFINYAQDYNHDGKKDIWNDKEDIFASMANYLNKNGWKEGQRWGRAVKLPKNFSEKMIGLNVKKTLYEWQKIGIQRQNGGAIPVIKHMKASIVVPAGLKKGEGYLVYDNYRTIMHWNRSLYFATSVGLLADLIAQ